MKEFILCFVPLFVAVDAVGTLPVLLAIFQKVPTADRRRVVRQSVLTAGAVALGFVAVGSGLLRLLGITVADFMVAGGILLFGISMDAQSATMRSPCTKLVKTRLEVARVLVWPNRVQMSQVSWSRWSVVRGRWSEAKPR